VNAFLLMWMTGTPSITIAVHDFQTEMTTKNPSLLITFLGGWSKFAIENPSDKDNELMGNIAGFQSIINVYNLNKGDGMTKDRKIEKLVKMDAKELEEWIGKKLK